MLATTQNPINHSNALQSFLTPQQQASNYPETPANVYNSHVKKQLKKLRDTLATS